MVQINGKVRDHLMVPTGLTREALQELALASEKIAQQVQDKQIVKVIAVPDKLVNVVVR